MSTHVDPTELRKASDAVFDVRSELSDEWGRLSKRASELFESRWRGAAAASYAGPWGECADGFGDVLSSLDFLAQSLEEARQQYQTQEAANTSAIDGAGSPGGLNLDY